MQGIVDELRELLSERLHVTVLDNAGCAVQIGAEDEGISGCGIDAVSSPGTADGGVAFGVVGGVVGHGDNQLAGLFGKLLEELLLQKLDVGDSEGCAGLLRGEDVAVAGGDGDLHGLHFRLSEQCVPSVSLGEGGAQQGVGKLCGAAGGKSELRKDGRPDDAQHVRGRVHEEGLAGGLLRLKGERDRHQNRWDGGDARLSRIAAGKSVGARCNGMLERGNGALRVNERQRQEEREKADRLDEHIRIHGPLIQISETCAPSLCHARQPEQPGVYGGAVATGLTRQGRKGGRLCAVSVTGAA